jgi:hypothetical protein
MVWGEDPYFFASFFGFVAIAFVLRLLANQMISYYASKRMSSSYLDALRSKLPNAKELISNNDISASDVITDPFNVLDITVSEQDSVWEFSKRLYKCQLLEGQRFNVPRKVFLLFHRNIYPTLEKWLPPVLLANLVIYTLLLKITPLDISVALTDWNIALSVILLLLNVNIPFSSLRVARNELNLTGEEYKAVRICIFLLHASGLLRSWGIYWKTMEVFQWIFKN